MSGNWSESYVGQLRKLVGHRKLIVPSIRAIIRNEKDEILYIKRKGNGKWALPAGGIELNESIFQCLQREVNEETGLLVIDATLIAAYTEPRFSVITSYGDEFQGFEFLFRVDNWSGNLVKETDETTDAEFFPQNNLPLTEPGFWANHEREAIEDLNHFDGAPRIK